MGLHGTQFFYFKTGNPLQHRDTWKPYCLAMMQMEAYNAFIV
jgi:hypothetical protein